MKNTFYILLLLIAGFVSYGQQLPHYSQFYFNKYSFNPAVGGTNPTVDVRSNHRYQWVGLTDAPRTYALTVNGPSKNLKMGFGGFLFTDHVGPTRRTGLQFSYSYIFNITQDIRLSLGLSGGLLEWKLDGHKINLYSAGDQVLVNSVMRTIIPDASFGFHLYHEKWHFGASAPNLLRSQLRFDNTSNTGLSRLEDHYYTYASYTFDVGNDFKVEPTALLKIGLPAQLQVDAMARVIWKDQLWIGGSYRNLDAINAMIGFTYGRNLSIGYSYDFTTSNLQNYSTGTHEIMLGVKFVKAQSFE